MMFRAVFLAAALASAANALPARASEVVAPTDESMAIEAGKGVLLRLDSAATTVFIADPEIADVQVKSPRLVYVHGKQPGETTLFAVDANDRILASRPIAVSHNLTRLSAALASLLPDAALSMRSIDSSLVVSGTVQTATDAETVRRVATHMVVDKNRLVMNLGVAAPSQVHLRVRVAEVSRDVLKQFGINWDAVFSTSRFAFGLATGVNPVATAGGVLVRNNGTDSLFGQIARGNWDINGLIDALDNEGMIKILAEPNLTALSGKTATFLAGGEFPMLVPEGEDRIIIQFKEFGVSLAFTPTIVGRDRISLKVKPEVSQLSNTGAVELQGFTVPSLTTRRAETTVELGGGQSFAIAGLLQNNMTHDIRKFPGLGDVPVLGTLFRSDSFRREETELVIIVTPYIVRPVSASMLAAPTDGLVPPSDTDRVLHGREYKPTAARGRRAPPGVAGFILD
ncbi:MAG: type II and III secretion system protein family protein [Alphaproteobacteria bacterium]|nr:type II and III secretion system protein family protein [Alphaproteobacteria bacterium]